MMSNTTTSYRLLHTGFTWLERSFFRRLGPLQHARLRRLGFRIRGWLFPGISNAASPPLGGSPPGPGGGPPAWVIQEIGNLAREVDPVLAPLRAVAMPQYFFPANEAPGSLYMQISRMIRGRPTHCFLLPWLVPGGADQGALHFIRAISRQPDARVLVVLTEPTKSPWLDRIPQGVQCLELGLLARRLSWEEQEVLLTRLLVQLAPPVVHIINSHLAWRVVERHGAAIRSSSRVYASLFCDDHDQEGIPVGYAVRFVQPCGRHLDAILTDGETFRQTLISRSGLPPEQIIPVYFPLEGDFRAPHDGRRRSILWAGRLAPQKCPGLLATIAEMTPHLSFSVYGSRSNDLPDPVWRRLANLPNIRLMGPFESFSSIPTHRFDAFLYTSAWDGLPNVVLEATLAGLPVIASDVGSIGEFITDKTGFPVSEIDDPRAYVRLLQLVIDRPELSKDRVLNAQALLRSRHRLTHFYNSVASIAGYLSPGAPSRATQMPGIHLVG
ncbi:MAG: glycosyltransferase family 4 protein [Devosia sp.]